MKKLPKPTMLRGSLITLRRKCGKPTCSCIKGLPHENPALSYSERGVTKIITIREKDIPHVRAALARHRKAIEDLDREALEGIDRLRNQVQREKAQSRETMQ